MAGYLFWIQDTSEFDSRIPDRRAVLNEGAHTHRLTVRHWSTKPSIVGSNPAALLRTPNSGRSRNYADVVKWQTH
jgi:hypothetical protein